MKSTIFLWAGHVRFMGEAAVLIKIRWVDLPHKQPGRP